ncbi:DgyrCDS7825 [Dimorphilus gyrociliatus]|uniref:Aromatic-L-amino-acid decarboxylase n=1 Tax=Dimorphilus gyrociliatus TaxID=2664684 RepID=A0A7I8VTZ4_9ANNE|nr:DgyrCDS7825 [Dimorphilus gyrociliatus]
MESVEFLERGKQLMNYIIDYFDTVDQRKTLPDVEPGYMKSLIPEEAPQKADEWKNVFGDLEKIIMPGITHWQSPHFHAFYPSGTCYASILAEMLSNSLSCVGFSWASSPACTELEFAMMDWLAKMLQLPEEFLSTGEGGGVIQGTASESTFLMLLAARSKALSKHINSSKSIKKLVVYTSDQAHSSVERACLLAAVEYRSVPSNENEEMTGEALEEMIQKDIDNGLIPFYVVATLGTTPSCAFDRLLEVGPVCKKHDIWLHIDAAYAGSSFICPEFRPLLDGVEFADSFNFNPHKWLLVTFDCSTLWLKNKKYLVESFNVDRIYLESKEKEKLLDYRNWQIPLGRRFRSLKIWFVLRLMGINNLQSYIRKHVELAKEFENLVRSSEKFEITHPVTMGIVCFRLKGDDQLTKNLHDALYKDKRIYLIAGASKSRYYLRFVVCSQRTTSDDINYAWKVINELSMTSLRERL